MTDIASALDDLVVANRILAHEGVVDAYGHVSIRHPTRADRFFIARSISPEVVCRDDLMEFDLNCVPVDPCGRRTYLETPIHGAIYAARPDIHAVVHNHAHEVIPFCVTSARLKPVIPSAAWIGAEVPVWDIRERFGTTNFLVSNLEIGEDLARCLGSRAVTLMRNHGATVVGSSIREAVHTAIYLMVNAKLQTEALRFGDVSYLTADEIALITKTDAGPRAWEYWARRCGISA